MRWGPLLEIRRKAHLCRREMMDQRAEHRNSHLIKLLSLMELDNNLPVGNRKEPANRKLVNAANEKRDDFIYPNCKISF